MSEDFSLLIKLLKMTTSSNDAEALVAMRKANEQVTRLNTDWEKLLRGKVTIIGDPFVAVKAPPQTATRKPPPPPSKPRPAPPPDEDWRQFGGAPWEFRSAAAAQAPQPKPRASSPPRRRARPTLDDLL